MENGNIELSASSFFFRTERYRAADFTIATWLARSTFVFINPSSAMRIIFLQPLENDVWHTLVISILIIIIALYITLAYECNKYKKYFKNGNLDPNNYHGFCKYNTLTFIALTIIGAFSQQGFALEPKLISSRIIVFWTLLSSAIIYQFYSASIVSTLLMNPPEYIKSLRDLIDSNLKMGIEDLPYNRDYFNKTTEPIEIELYNKLLMQTSNNENLIFLTAQEGLNKVLDGNYAFNGDISAIYPLIVKEFPEDIVCQLSQVQLVPSYLQYMAIVVQNLSPYKEMVTFGLKRLQETGIMSRLLHIYTHEKPPCGQSILRIPSVDLDEFIPALVLLFMGVCFAFVMLVFEYIWNHNIPKKIQHYFGVILFKNRK